MKIKLVILPLLLALSALPLFSQDGAGDRAQERVRDRLMDNAGLLTPDQKDRLMAFLDTISEKHQFDLVIVTENSIGGAEARDYADDFFDYNGYGIGSDRDGSLFLIVTETRDYWISSSGRGINILNSTLRGGDGIQYDNAFKKMEYLVVFHLKTDSYYAACNSFWQSWDTYLTPGNRVLLEVKEEAKEVKKEKGPNFFNQYTAFLTIVGWLIALIIGFSVVHGWKMTMNAVLPQTQAGSYVVPDSLILNEKTDRFLYSEVTKTKREKREEDRFSGSEDSSSGGGYSSSGSVDSSSDSGYISSGSVDSSSGSGYSSSGSGYRSSGSDSHTSSSGNTHGGGGGKY